MSSGFTAMTYPNLLAELANPIYSDAKRTYVLSRLPSQMVMNRVYHIMLGKDPTMLETVYQDDRLVKASLLSAYARLKEVQSDL